MLTVKRTPFIKHTVSCELYHCSLIAHAQQATRMTDSHNDTRLMANCRLEGRALENKALCLLLIHRCGTFFPIGMIFMHTPPTAFKPLN